MAFGRAADLPLLVAAGTAQALLLVAADSAGTAGIAAVFSPEFTGRRAQILSHDHTYHLEHSDCQYQTIAACVPLSTKHFSSVQCSPSSIFRAQTVFKFK